MKFNKLLISIIILIILFSFNTFAFAVTSYYWDKKPLFLDPGESIEIEAFGIQNMAGNEDMTMEVKQISGYDIAEILDESPIYDVPLGTKNNYVNMRITIPEDAQIGEEYNIGASFKKVQTAKGGNIQLRAGMTNNIVVIVGQRIDKTEQVPEVRIPEPPREDEKSVVIKAIKKNYSGLGAVLVIFILIIIILFHRYESKKKTKRRR